MSNQTPGAQFCGFVAAVSERTDRTERRTAGESVDFLTLVESFDGLRMEASTMKRMIVTAAMVGEPTNAVLSVRRVSQGNTYVLGSYAISNGTSAVWVPEADYPFVFGETLEITSSVMNGNVQVIRKGG